MAKNRLKNALKKIGKAAAVAGAGYLAMKGLGGKKGIAFGRPKKGTIDQMAADAKMPGNLSKDMGMKRKQFMPGIVDYMAKGGRAGHKSGGKVKGCGIAKRGLGRAMKKGKR